jgi:hypothetical protein
MHTNRKTKTWMIVPILLIGSLLVSCGACGVGEQAGDLIIAQQKLIEDFKKNYVELTSTSEFDKAVMEVKGKDVADIDKYIAELKGYKIISESAKKAETATNKQEAKGYFDTVHQFITDNQVLVGFLAKKALDAFTLYMTGATYALPFSIPNRKKKKELEEQIIEVAKEGLRRRHHFNAKLATLDDVVDCNGSLIAIWENIKTTKNTKK